jgi:hypothetical protein
MPRQHVNWEAIKRNLKAMNVGTRFVSSTDHPGAFHYNKIDIETIAEFAELNEPVPSDLYQRYYPWMKTWSAKNIARAVKDTPIVDQIWSDIVAHLTRLWKSSENRSIIKSFESAGVTVDDVEIWYLRQFCDLFLSSTDIYGLLIDNEMVADEEAIIELYGEEHSDDDDDDDQ